MAGHCAKTGISAPRRVTWRAKTSREAEMECDSKGGTEKCALDLQSADQNLPLQGAHSAVIGFALQTTSAEVFLRIPEFLAQAKEIQSFKSRFQHYQIYHPSRIHSKSVSPAGLTIAGRNHLA